MQPPGLLRNVWNIIITLVLWGYFTVGFMVLFAPRYLFYYLRENCPEAAFQRLNQQFFKSFFGLLGFLIPRAKLAVPEALAALRGMVVVSNHLSYLDPLIFITLFPRHKTIVKAALFDIPIFGWLLTRTGYLPSEFQQAHPDRLEQQLNRLPGFFEQGGNLFIFPEGTRSRSGKLGGFNKSAFALARHHGRPVAVVHLENTQYLYAPGHFAFNTGLLLPPRLTLLAVLSPQDRTTRQLREEARALMDALEHLAESASG